MWPKYTAENEHFLNLDKEDYVGQYLHADDVNFWREIVPKILKQCNDEPSIVPKRSSDTCDAEGDCN